MDEATSSLDYLKERQIIQALKKIKLNRITLAHRIDTILAADRVLSVAAGRVIEISKADLRDDYLKNFSRDLLAASD